MSTVAVIGAGAWGTALAAHAARLGHRVRLWAREDEVVRDINEARENKAFLPGVSLVGDVRASTDPAAVAAGADLAVFVPPSAYMRRVAEAFAAHMAPTTRVTIATKGIEDGSLKLMIDVVAEAMPRFDKDQLSVLSGPSFAKEVGAGLPTDVVVASKDAAVARFAQDTLHSPMFRIYSSSDPIGVEIGGALKNVLAIAAGACDGLNLGNNARAALITRGLSEMARLGVALGANPLTFLGMSGVGDLILTCTGGLSRNRTLGLKVAEGLDAREYLKSQRTVAEGFLTAKAAHELGKRAGVELPVAEQVYCVLHEGRPLAEAFKALTLRESREELWGIA